MRVRTTLRFSLFTYSQKRALEWWTAARYLEDQAQSLQDQVPQASPCWNLIETSQERKNAHEESQGVAVNITSPARRNLCLSFRTS
ncbi:MAG TPA: hypothetical protein VK638_11235, partial [Edaphobacter sp.]|nr:hypothetical protein [Edaphobacter sp.]